MMIATDVVFIRLNSYFSLFIVQTQCLAPDQVSVQAKESVPVPDQVSVQVKESVPVPDQVSAQAEKMVLCLPFAKKLLLYHNMTFRKLAFLENYFFMTGVAKLFVKN
jgi:hypothetical protein